VNWISYERSGAILALVFHEAQRLLVFGRKTRSGDAARCRYDTQRSFISPLGGQDELGGSHVEEKT